MTTYECKGRGISMTRKHLESIFEQTYRPIQCVISDHSKNSEIEDLVKSMESKGVDVVYTRHLRDYGNISSNMNNAAKYATGDYIQHVSMDDWYHDTTAVSRLVAFMDADPSIEWAILPCWCYPQEVCFTPSWPSYFNFTVNTIGGPPSVIIRSSLKNITFDERIAKFLDIVWFYNLYKASGSPREYTGPAVYTNYTHPLPCTYNFSNEDRQKDINTIISEYGELTIYMV